MVRSSWRPTRARKSGSREGFYIHCVSQRQHRIHPQLLTILLDGYPAILRNHELGVILEVIQTAGEAPESGMDLFARIEFFRPDFQSDRAGSVRDRRTQQGKRFCEALARNATGSIALKIWV